uniref:Uncharacterized protein n=1 Tax=Anopheles quadriannulatus TaxID=34691 RepID=A0A182XQH7_ANOQN
AGAHRTLGSSLCRALYSCVPSCVRQVICKVRPRRRTYNGKVLWPVCCNSVFEECNKTQRKGGGKLILSSFKPCLVISSSSSSSSAV